MWYLVLAISFKAFAISEFQWLSFEIINSKVRMGRLRDDRIFSLERSVKLYDCTIQNLLRLTPKNGKWNLHFKKNFSIGPPTHA